MKTFLSIGTGPGMGLATAERFAQAGYRVVLSARTRAKLDAMAAEFNSRGYVAQVKIVEADDPSSVNDLIAAVVQEHGAIDVLHYNAASLRQATVIDQPLDSFLPDLAVNIGGALAAIHACLPGMRQAQSGSILLTGGGFGVAPHPDYLSLSVGKAGIRTLSLGLFETLRADGIHIATVTVSAYVKPGSHEAVEIAQQFYDLHNQPVQDWRAEFVYEPAAVEAS
ncbi:SDR family NAD(P)-dependent oxidoreductase [Pseudomonas capsici]|uniref:SDR family oxidoreductase n=1 Tax=Pseudomonas capsici TaxID=2810614 RepID=UPI0021F1D2FF|nr:SDR family NAD(P)-dependent oxidoreductase [Pseudomonas capsici]MCV4273904.1 SDR family NAD(P)-dependent oxidoreductase [Pseudomonas capsici]